jgi:hypothetical protein
MKVLSRKLPYHEYMENDEVQSALSRGERPKRPSVTNHVTENDIDMIDDQFWELITGCCRLQPENRPTALKIQKLLAKLEIQDDRSDVQKIPGAAILSLRKHANVEWDRVEQILGQIEVCCQRP